jgi:protein tyrosine phosphatase (PTP) superfamily phosphohydrolase (DUF442 family)
MASRFRFARRAAFAGAVALSLLAFARVAFPVAVQPGPLAINYVEAVPGLATGGMPRSAQFARIADAGFDMIVNLAPDDALGAHADEQALVRRQGMGYAHLPIDFAAPGAADYERFATLMRSHEGHGRTLVHCQLNLRASSLVFLYRVIERGEPADNAYDAVVAVWRPNETWRRFLRETLRAHGKALPMELENG